MLALRLEVTLELDGSVVPGFPVQRRIVASEGIGFDYVKASGTGFAALPVGEIDALVALLVRSDATLTVRLNGQTDAGIVLNPGGFVLIVDGLINAGAGVNVTVDNQSGGDARVDGLAVGN